jgi:hypothetical protein
MNIIVTILGKLKEHVITIVVGVVVAGIYSAWDRIAAVVDDHIETIVTARLNEPESKLAKSAAEFFVSKSTEARLGEAGAITAGSAVLSAEQPSYTFVLFLPKANRASLYVSIDWSVLQEDSSVLLQADQSTIRRFRDEGAFEIPGLETILQQSSLVAANNTDLDPTAIELVIPIQGHMADAHAITFQLSGWSPDEDQAPEVKIKYLAIITPFIRLDDQP